MDLPQFIKIGNRFVNTSFISDISITDYTVKYYSNSRSKYPICEEVYEGTYEYDDLLKFYNTLLQLSYK